MKYNNAISALFIGVTALMGLIPILYPGLQRGQMHWLMLGAVALAVLAAVMPVIIHCVRRARGLPPEQSASDLRFTMTLIAILCPLTFFAVWMSPTFGSLLIMVVPIAFMIRAQIGNQPNSK